MPVSSPVTRILKPACLCLQRSFTSGADIAATPAADIARTARRDGPSCPSSLIQIRGSRL